MEVYELFLEYAQFADNLDILWFNMAYHAGQVIKNISNIVMYFIATEFTRVADGFTFGLEIGQIIWMIFYPTSTYIRQQRDEGYEFKIDYTWGAIAGIEIPDEEETLPFQANAAAAELAVDGSVIVEETVVEEETVEEETSSTV